MIVTLNLHSYIKRFFYKIYINWIDGIEFATFDRRFSFQLEDQEAICYLLHRDVNGLQNPLMKFKLRPHDSNGPSVYNPIYTEKRLNWLGSSC